jgi:hypothetical protein
MTTREAFAATTDKLDELNLKPVHRVIWLDGVFAAWRDVPCGVTASDNWRAGFEWGTKVRPYGYEENQS